MHPQPIVGLGNPAIFVQGSKQDYKEYTNLETLAKDFANSTNVYKKADAIWKQDNKPYTISVITFAEDSIADAAKSYFYNDWHFALLANYEENDALALSNLIEENEFKFLVIQTSTVEELSVFAGNNLTIGLVHPSEEYFDAALIGNTANLTVGSVTWKFRHDLVGITANPLTVGQLQEIDSANAIAYVTKAGIPQTSEGKTLGGEFIDSLHGDHWVKSNIETKVQRLLSTTDKLTFDSNGIALLDTTVANVLETAFTNRIIDIVDETGVGNYSVTALSRQELNPDDVAARNYKGLSFKYKRSGAIHTVDVTGTIEV
ncbi:DUF3383 family protein [Enterococcus faecalis]|uniref:DUF3383 family protein n=1 Tax=Enterococcus faecalis TaxID=1351 RepID=UPI002DBC7192|nr:DUF3383 family protein [Enterococcus faecalis]MEB7774838.1 DUF3383 domain-containing protein [Enterococcus faecalis]